MSSSNNPCLSFQIFYRSPSTPLLTTRTQASQAYTSIYSFRLTSQHLNPCFQKRALAYSIYFLENPFSAGLPIICMPLWFQAWSPKVIVIELIYISFDNIIIFDKNQFYQSNLYESNIILFYSLRWWLFNNVVYLQYNLMAQRKYHRGQIYHEDGSDSEEVQEIKGRQKGEQPLFARDYITLKHRQGKNKLQNEQALLEYYTNQKYKEYLSKLKPSNKVINSKNSQQYRQMCEMARQGKNICVFGKGSKIQLLRKLQSEELPEYHSFYINAYLPSVTQKKIYSHFGGMLVQIGYANQISKLTIRDQLEEYKQILTSHNNVNIVIVLNSIDGPNLKTPQSQQRLAQLIDIPQIQLICSLDDMNMAYCWSSITLQKFKFLFYNIDTMQPYKEELKFCQLKSESRESAEDSLLCVWQSLNKNQKQILKFIAERQLANLSLNEPQVSHYSFQQLLDKCIEEIVLSSDHQLRQNLLELLDHKVIIDRNDQRKNKKIYIMKYQKRTLEKLIDFKID